QEHALTFPLIVDRKLDQVRQLMGVGEGAGPAAGAIDRDLHAAVAGLREKGTKARAIFPRARAKSLADAGRRNRRHHLASCEARRHGEAASAEIILLHGYSLEAVTREERKQG